MANSRNLFLAAFILLAVLSRLIPHPPNLTPITAIALFSGAYFAQKKFAFLLPLLLMVFTDAFVGFHQHVLVIYFAFFLIVLVGFWLKSHRSPLKIAGATLFSSVLFFVTTNFGVWSLGTMYPNTWQGLVTCYVAAIPFFQNMLMGDILYVSVLFGGFSLLERGIPALQTSQARSS